MLHPAGLHRSVTRWLILATVALGAVALAGCGSSSSSSSSSGSAAASASSSSFASLKSDLASHAAAITSYQTIPPVSGVSKLKGKTVWWVPLGAAIPTLAAVGSSMQQALSHVGIKMQTCDGKLLPTATAACLNQAATSGAAGVVTGFVDYAAEPVPFNNLISHHIPVLVAGEEPDGGKTSTAQLGFYPTRSADNQMQRLDMETAITGSSGKAKILYIGVTDSPETKEQASYAKQFAAQHCPSCGFTEIDYNTAAINKLSSAVSAALLSNPSTTYVICEVDACTPSAVAGIQTAGYKTKVKLISANGNLSSLQLIKSGGLEISDTGISSSYYGWQFADGIIRMMTGKPPVPTVTIERVFNKSNVAPLTLTPAAYATNAWYGSNAYEQTFLNAWSGK